jgi:predicted permease
MLTDLRYAIRSLRRSPGFTIVAIMTLGLGIGANTTVFSWMEGLVLQPLPLVRDPSRLVSVSFVSHGEPNGMMSYPAFSALAERTRTVDGFAAFAVRLFGLQDRNAVDAAAPVGGAYTSVNYFRTLGVGPVLGRTFEPADTLASAEPVVVLGHALWRQRFGQDAGVIGRTVRVNGLSATIIGVAPPGFLGAEAGYDLQLWAPLSSYDRLGDREGELRTVYSRWLTVFGRLHTGASLQAARAELDVVGRRLVREHPELELGATSAGALPFSAGDAPRILRPLFTALLGVTIVLLLIVCANVANLMLARSASRRRELGVRAALGASRGRLARHLLAECIALAIPGALLGVAFASWGRDALHALVPQSGTPLAVDTPLDLQVLGFAMALTVVAIIIFGLAPALRASRSDFGVVLKGGTPGSGVSRSRLRSALVVAQIALSLTAVVSAALFVRTLRALEQIDRGFRDPSHVLLVSTDFGFTGVRDTATIRTTVERLIERTGAIPGVATAGVATHVPMGLFGGNNVSFSVPGYTAGRDEHPSAWVNYVSPNYFDVMRIAVVRGRALSATDAATGARQAIVVNETFANRYLAGRDPVGAPIALGIGEQPNAIVVGVARNVVRGFDGIRALTGAAQPAYYASFAAAPAKAFTLHLRTTGDPLALVPAVRRTFADVAPGLPLLRPETLAEHATGAFFLQRIGAMVLGALGGVVVLLAALGLYGVTAHAVTERTREAGVRVALGATSRQVMQTFLAESLRLAGIGLAIGALGALAIGGLLASQLYGVGGRDPLTLVGTALLLALVAAVATYLPARRATRVDPVIALRSE